MIFSIVQVSQRPPVSDNEDGSDRQGHNPAYDNVDFWLNSLNAPAEQERLRKTRELLPKNVRNALDVGCGDGRVSRILHEHCSLVSLDINKGALITAGGNVVQASASKLPFRDRSFDLVCCTEVLEHLPDDSYTAALSELIRVSTRYVLISIPDNEDMLESTTRCPQCSLLYHLWGHERLFSRSSMENISSELRLLDVQTCGEYKRTPKITQWIRQHIGGQWPVSEHVSCPECGCQSGDKLRKNLVTYACAAAERFIPRRPTPRWAICLYERTSK